MANLLTPRISATELARNLASAIDQVRVSRSRLIITRGNQDVAQLVPVISNGATLADLDRLLKRHSLSREEKRAFSKDLRTIREAATLPTSAWD